MEQFFSIIIPKRKLRLLGEQGLICHCAGQSQTGQAYRSASTKPGHLC